MSKAKDIHLWWVWNDPKEATDELRKIPEQLTACGLVVPWDELTDGSAAITCQKCKIKYYQQAAA